MPEDHAAGCGGTDTTQALIDQTAMILLHVKITELRLEMDESVGFTRLFTYLKWTIRPRTRTCC
jgi:hypothetical protein